MSPLEIAIDRLLFTYEYDNARPAWAVKRLRKFKELWPELDAAICQLSDEEYARRRNNDSVR